MITRRLLIVWLTVSPLLLAQRHPDFTGTWSSATATPFERQAQYKDQEFFTKEQAAAYEREMARRNEERPDNANSRNYNETFYEHSVHLSKTLRTSIITEPADGKLPALLPELAEKRKRRIDALNHPAKVQDMGLQDRCMSFEMAVPPMIPYRYNSNYRFVQTGDTLMINAEMGHDSRVIPIGGRAHAPDSVRLWLGDSIARWEGDTLVVDSTNFNDAGGFYGDAGGMFGWDRNMHVVERFSLLDKDTILYRFEVNDPTAFTKPWKGETTMYRTTGDVYEFACHEGNYSLPDLLSILQAEDAARSAGKK